MINFLSGYKISIFLSIDRSLNRHPFTSHVSRHKTRKMINDNFQTYGSHTYWNAVIFTRVLSSFISRLQRISYWDEANQSTKDSTHSSINLLDLYLRGFTEKKKKKIYKECEKKDGILEISKACLLRKSAFRLVA